MSCPCDFAGVAAALPAAMPAFNLIFAMSVLYHILTDRRAAMLLIGIVIVLASFGDMQAIAAWTLAAAFFVLADVFNRALQEIRYRLERRRMARENAAFAEYEKTLSKEE